MSDSESEWSLRCFMETKEDDKGHLKLRSVKKWLITHRDVEVEAHSYNNPHMRWKQCQADRRTTAHWDSNNFVLLPPPQPTKTVAVQTMGAILIILLRVSQSGLTASLQWGKSFTRTKRWTDVLTCDKYCDRQCSGGKCEKENGLKWVHSGWNIKNAKYLTSHRVLISFGRSHRITSHLHVLTTTHGVICMCLYRQVLFSESHPANICTSWCRSWQKEYQSLVMIYYSICTSFFFA